MAAVLASAYFLPAAAIGTSSTQVLATCVIKILRAFFCLDLAGWVCAAWAVLGPWCEIHLAPGLERGLLMVIRKGHHPEGLGSGHREGEDKEVVIVVLTGAPNLLLEALTLNGGYSHHLSSHTLSPMGNSGL